MAHRKDIPVEKRQEYDRRYRERHAEELRAYQHEYTLSGRRKVPSSSRKKAYARTHKWKQAARKYLLEHKLANPCACGETEPRVLDLDHREEWDKVANVSALVNASNCEAAFKRMVAELQKCDVRCANCHRRKTFRLTPEAHPG